MLTKRTKNYETARNVSSGVSTAAGLGATATALGLIGKTTAAGTAMGGPIGGAVGLIAGAAAAGFGALAGKGKKKDAEKEQAKAEADAATTAAGAERLLNQRRMDGARGGMELPVDDPHANEQAELRGDASLETEDAVDLASKTAPAATPAATPEVKTKTGADGADAGTGAVTENGLDPGVAGVTDAANFSSKVNTAGNLINTGAAVYGLINAARAKPVEEVQPQITKAPDAPSLVDDNTEAVRAMAESRVNQNLGAAERQMIESGVNPAMVQSIKASQANNASMDIASNLAQNKQQIAATNAQISNQHKQFGTQVSMQNAQAINQANQFNAQNQAAANQANMQSLMQNLAALSGGMQNMGKIRLDKANMVNDLELYNLQKKYYQKLIA